MKVIHLARKPLSEPNLASNVLKWGTGGINIDASRIGTSDNLNGGAYAEQGTDRWDGAENWRYKRFGGAGQYVQPTGRWPANVILEHLPGCQDRCVPGCPVDALDERTGTLRSGSGTVKRATGADQDGNTGSAYGAESRPAGTPQIWYGDEGGASRYFKQVKK